MRCLSLFAIHLALIAAPIVAQAASSEEILARAEEMAAAFLGPRGLSRDSFQPPQVSDQMGMISVLWLPKDFKSPWSLVAFPDAKLICRQNSQAQPRERPDCDSGYATSQRMIPQILP